MLYYWSRVIHFTNIGTSPVLHYWDDTLHIYTFTHNNECCGCRPSQRFWEDEAAPDEEGQAARHQGCLLGEVGGNAVPKPQGKNKHPLLQFHSSYFHVNPNLHVEPTLYKILDFYFR